jgi:hypothetical protein
MIAAVGYGRIIIGFGTCICGVGRVPDEERE